MDSEKEHQEQLSKILHISEGYGGREEPATWARIYIEIGRLLERANGHIEITGSPIPESDIAVN